MLKTGKKVQRSNMNSTKVVAVKKRGVRQIVKKPLRSQRLSMCNGIIASKSIGSADKILNKEFDPYDFEGRLNFLKQNFKFCLADRCASEHAKKKDIIKNDYWLVLQHIVSEAQEMGKDFIVKTKK
jgi:hypothetical protein